MDNKKNGIPKLRFPGFTGAWEQRKLGEVADIFDGTHQTPKYTDSGIKFVSVENIATLETEKYISQKAYESEYSNKQAEKGDVLMTRIGNIGTPKLIEKDEPLAYYVTLALLKPKNIDSNFLAWGISSPKVQRNIWKLTLHIAFPKKINLGEINQVSISIPSINEQKKIGDFFKQLDSLIALHQRKLEHLQEQKKGLLQKMFPKNGENVPEVRFPGFTDAWEQRKFFDNIEKVIDFRGRTPKKLGMEWSAEGYTALSALNVKDGYIDFTADVHYANQDLYDKWMAGNELYKGQVLFTTEAPMGNVAQVPDNRKYVLSQRTIAFNVDKTKVTNDFLAVLLRSQNVQHTLKSLASGGTAQGVSQKSLSQLKVILPINPKEQQEIGNFFNHFDSLITLHQRKLDHLELMKKGLLQQMFV